MRCRENKLGIRFDSGQCCERLWGEDGCCVGRKQDIFCGQVANADPHDEQKQTLLAHRPEVSHCVSFSNTTMPVLELTTNVKVNRIYHLYNHDLEHHNLACRSQGICP